VGHDKLLFYERYAITLVQYMTSDVYNRWMQCLQQMDAIYTNMESVQIVKNMGTDSHY